MDLSGLMKAFGGRRVRRKVTVAQSYDLLIAEEADKLLDDEAIKTAAIAAVEQSGIVFIDEIDKVATRADTRGGEISREGVQRDLLPLIEGTTVSTKYGPVKTDHILFIASGAFHVAKPSDLLPELQGRLPIRVELKALTRDDFRRILTETEAHTRQVVEMVPAHIAHMDRAYRYTFSNNQLSGVFPGAPARILGRTRSPILAAAVSSIVPAFVMASMRTGRAPPASQRFCTSSL